MRSTPCPCQSELPYRTCCEPLIKNKNPATTAKALMRSRYTAFATGQINYLVETRHPKYRSLTEAKEIAEWMAEVTEWESLEILITDMGEASDTVGLVAFNVTVRQNGSRQTFYECSRFSKLDGRWVYEKGVAE